MNLAMLLEMAAGSFGEREAVRCGELAFDYAGLERAARAAAGAIVASGCRHAALLDETSPAVPIGLFAAAWAGVPFVPLSYRLTDVELDALLERIAPAHLVTEAARAPALAARAALHAVPSDAWLAGLAAAAAPDPGAWPDDAEAPAVLLFTSGTTGTPKAAVLRHRHLVSYILGSVEFGAAGEDEATLVAVPPYHIAAMAAVLSSVYAGRRIVQLPRFDARAWIALTARERATHAFLVPTMLARIVDVLAQEPTPLPALRAIAYGGGKMPLPVIERALALLPHVDFTNAYGLTETSSTVALLDPEAHRAAHGATDPLVRRRLASVGRALPSVEIEIRDAEGKPVPAGERGEVCVRGEQVAGEYLGRGSQLGRDGWFATRDAGFLDADGFLFLEGRLDDVIVRGGENLSPGEIEDALRDHAAVADCAVVGVPDEQWGEAVAAAVVLREGTRANADELRAWVRERLRSSRVPQRIEFRDALPYTETGKLLRRRVRADLAGETPAP
jgi:acyl-CoA synthetase (AMP-forming)/AMP-acid ligase II